MGSQIATSAVPGGIGFNRVPSGTQGGGGEVTWDEMGQLGLHKALNEYYKLSASQQRMRCCNRDGTPTMLCTVFHAVVIPQLPAVLAPPALLAAAGWLLYAGAWVLYKSAALTIPLALWLAFAVDGRLSLSPHAVARLPAAAGSAAARVAGAVLPLPAGMQQPVAAALLLAALLVLLRASEAAVLRRRRQLWEAAQQRVTPAKVQASYAGWAPPSDAPYTSVPAAVQQEQRQQGDSAGGQQEIAPLSLQATALLSVLQGEVQQLWHNVIGDGLPTSMLQSYEDVAAAVGRLSQETGVELRSPAGGGSNGSMDSGRQLLDAVLHIKHAVGLA